MNRTKKLTQIALLTAFALIIHTVEATIPVPVAIPGAKLGLANIITLLAFVLYGFRTAMLVTVVRTVLGSIFVGSFPGTGFFLSFTGGIASTLAMAIGLYLWRRERISLAAVSIIGAVFHNTAQVSLASLLIGNINLLKLYLPPLLLLAIPTGFFTGLAVSYTYGALRRAGAALKA